MSQEALLRGRLYLPEEILKKIPVIIMGHGFTTTVSGMTADKYAERFRTSGYAVLLYDHRNLGLSGGEPRQQINFWVQSRGYIDAINFVATQKNIDSEKIAVWGASMSAREAFLVGAVDKRVNAIITMIPAFSDDFPKPALDDQSYEFAKQTLLKKRISDLPHTVGELMPIVSPDQNGMPSILTELSAYRWFIEYGRRFDTNWKNEASISTTKTPEGFHVGQCAQHLTAPILMIVAKDDEMSGASPSVTKTVFENIIQPKKWVDIVGGHFGLLYFPSELFNKSSRAQIEFLNETFK